MLLFETSRGKYQASILLVIYVSLAGTELENRRRRNLLDICRLDGHVEMICELLYVEG